MGQNLKAARAALHFYEEPFLSGESGSGASFFRAAPCIAFIARTGRSPAEDRKKAAENCSALRLPKTALRISFLN